MIGAEYGIGAFVLQAGNLMQTDQLLAGVVILSLFGLAVGKLINMLETRLLHWRGSPPSPPSFGGRGGGRGSIRAVGLAESPPSPGFPQAGRRQPSPISPGFAGQIQL